MWQTWPFRIVLAAITIGALAVGIGAYERRKVRLQLRTLERERAIERERVRISRDIHDDLGAGLTQIGLLADLGLAKPADAAHSEEHFTSIAARARAAHSALDEIVWAANPRNDSLPKLADYLCRVADDCFDSSSIRCRKDVPTSLPPVPMRAELRHNLALAIKEALTNALKHSGAKMVWLRLAWAEPELRVEVEDDGIGFGPGAESRGRNGLQNQAARMKDIGGTVEVHSAAGKGTRIVFSVRIPSD